ncbi:beta-phosphoglucomutase family hydrolase [Vibrio sp. 404]|uniref:Beta-phosphoglucomutase family hydrolase n=1 Tax=Vibrio marinisediminis TaxID=2758441 RepID=A0A7W2IU59_9VIBR|nr:beta-phosphoglucomutase family hydrolase [Vibrio marinisediminis]MBA5763240.1 beta-phosphoglucomutase family hydrolase [Vibrio marinisediminis]
MPLNYDQYHGFIFDMDGTLLDTMPVHLIAWEQTAKKYRFPYSKDWIYSMGGMPSLKILAEINKRYQLNIPIQQASQFKMSTFTDISNHVKRIKPVTDVLEKHVGLKKIAVGTGSQCISAKRLLKLAGLYENIEVLISANDVEHHKPNPDTFLLAAEQLDLQPSQCLVFEDTVIGRQAAHAAQMDCVLWQDEQLVLYPWRGEK